MNDPIEGVAVLIAVFIAVIFGFVTEFKAQKSVESLQSMIKSTTNVLRDGKIEVINSDELVVGDIIKLSGGDSINADARLVQTQNFACIESALTGESAPVSKDSALVFDEETSLGDRKNYVYAGTAVTRGNATAVVTATGMRSEVGQISDMLKQHKKEETPLNKELNHLGKLLIGLAALFAGIVIVLGLLTGRELSFIIQIALILAIAAIPEAMPAVSTITLARGMARMSEHKALVKSLPAVETLGSTSVICSDKTGTLTENQMTVSKIYLLNKGVYNVSGGGYHFEGDVSKDGEKVVLENETELKDFIYASVLNTNATIKTEDNGEKVVIGDPTEGALITLGKKLSIDRNSLEENGHIRVDEIPFNSKLKYMITLYEHEGKRKTYIKGGPDVLLDMSNHDQDTKERIEKENQALAKHGLRVLAIGEITDNEAIYHNNCDGNVKILGLVGIVDPPREDVKEAIKICQDAGIRVKMITGDHPQTASMIAKEIGMDEYEETMTGFEFDVADKDENFPKEVCKTGVFARVSPRNKLEIVNILKDNGEVVAMTGDGVNDAPALNGADIGVAMGIRGTEVAKEAADMILTNDRFSTIINAVKEGRIIFANIRKFVYYLFSCNMVEITAIMLSLIFLLPDLPVQPLHILWLNLVVDIFPAMSLGFEPAEDNIMKQQPRGKEEGLLTKKFLVRILLSGAVLGVSSFVIYQLMLLRGAPIIEAQTTTFTLMAIMQLLHILNVRREKTFGLDKSLLKNKSMIFSMLLAITLQLVAVYVPVFNDILGTVPLPFIDWVLILGISIIATVLVYALKKVFALK
ncbi:HAD-IC family P-type ATPase [Breznakia sp. OttesenSCG-928-G09]|nr:HAD-IC family P-type ATPase [Breznakia sp. OttesenSCG-928-G09]